MLAGMAVTFWLMMLLLAGLAVPQVLLALIPAVFVGYVIYRVVRERVGNAEEDHYDRMDH